MVDKYTDKVGEFVGALAEQLGQTSGFVYETLVKQQMAEGVVNLIVYLLVVIANIYLWRSHSKYDKRDDRDGDLLQAWGIVNTMISIVLIIYLFFFLGEDMLQIMNPHYYAIQDVFDFIGDITN